MNSKALKAIGDLALNEAGTLALDFIFGEGDKLGRVTIDLPGDAAEAAKIWGTQCERPTELVVQVGAGTWAFRGKVFDCGKIEEVMGADRLLLLIKHRVLSEERQWARIEREVRAFENMGQTVAARRERIPESVRLFVWQRDEGRCVRCGTNEDLEFDHIIPLVEGGSNTERNVQLLCERCNRIKGRQV